MFYAKEKNHGQAFREELVFKEDQVCTALSKSFFGDKTSELLEKTDQIIRQLKDEGVVEKIIQKYAQ